MNNLLIIEDSDYKRERIIELVNQKYPNFEVTQARSFSSGWKALSKSEYDVVILDMSLPTFDVGNTESGGSFRTFGGKELAQKCKRRDIKTKIIFVTQYKNFSFQNTHYTFNNLKDEISKEFTPSVFGFVHFNSNSSDWKIELTDLLRELHENFNS